MNSTTDDLSTAAAALGRKGGLSTSEKKRAASRENGKRGGRPRKSQGEIKMADKITSKTTLAQIKDYARADFGVELTTEQAREIKEKGARGMVIWTPSRCTVHDGFVIVRGKIL